MIIEAPNIEDYEKINRIALQVHNIHVKWRPDLFLNVDKIFEREELNEMISAEKIFVAKDKDNIIGFVTFTIAEKNARGCRYRKQLQIDIIGVDENHRGNGIGTSLLKFMKDYASVKKCTDIYLTVNEENEGAIALYEKMGMKLKNIAYSMQL